MSYPLSYDTFTTKKDKGETISSEAHVIPGSPYTVTTNYPILQSVSIPGYTEVPGIPGPAQYRVDYRTSIIYFNAANTGASIAITYITTGSPIRAADINSLQSGVTNIESTLGLSPQGAYTTVRDRLDALTSSYGHTHRDWLTPAGTIDGINNAFTLPEAPNPVTSVEVTVNGLHLEYGTEYTVSGADILFTSQVPEIGDTVRAKYRV